MLAGAGYGNDTAFRSGLTELGLEYPVGVQGSMTVWMPGREPRPAKAWLGQGLHACQELAAQDVEDGALARRDQGPSQLALRRIAITGVRNPGRRNGF